jgi:uncharacterized membrane protein YraQ (UPF0718 family)
MDAIMLGGALVVAARVAADAGLHGDAGYLSAAPPVSPAVMAALGLAFRLLRAGALRRAVQAVAADRAARDAE